MNFPINLNETPGGVYALAYWLGAMIFVLLNEKKISKAPLIVISSSFLVLLVSLMELNHPVSRLWFVPSIMLYVSILCLFIYLVLDLPFINIVYYTAKGFLIGEFIGSLTWQLYYFFVVNKMLPLNIWSAIIFITVIEVIVFSVILSIEYKFFNDDDKFNINLRELISTIVIVVIIFIFSNLSYLTGNTPFSGQATAEIFNIRTLIDFGGIVLLFAFQMQISEVNMKLEVGKLQNLIKLQVENYELSKKSIEMVNQKYHDLKHHITVLKANAQEIDSYNYLTDLENEIKIYEAQNKTGNHVLDIILTAKSITCQSNNIRLNVIVDGKLLSIFSPIDISALFGNLLDNAIENVKLITEREKRLIYLNISQQKNFIIIKLENPYIGKITYKNGLPLTTKKDKINHGYGLKSVLNIIRKYDGSLTLNDEEEWFEVRILIPINNN